MRFIPALCALFVAAPVAASTYRIDVTGELKSITMLSARNEFGEFIGHSVTLDEFSILWTKGSAGSIIATETGFTNCSGFLVQMCSGARYEQSGYTYASATYWGQFQLSETGYRYEDDSGYIWTTGGERFFTTSGAVIEFEISDLKVSEIPLPAPAFLLLTALAWLPVRRYARRGAVPG